MVNRFRRPIKSKARKPASAPEGKPLEVEIERIGARADGIAHAPDGPLFVPLAAPGDRLIVRPGEKRGEGRQARIERIVQAGPGRIEPPCPVYGRCGGCALQHVEAAIAAEAKSDWLAQALGARGLDTQRLQPLAACPAGERRRARFAAKKLAAGWVLGFNEAQGAQIVDLQGCPALVAELRDLPAGLHDLLAKLPGFGQAGDILATVTDSGIDLVLYPAKPGEPALADREALADFANAHDLARIAWAPQPSLRPEPVLTRKQPREKFDAIAADIPPGSFLQPSRAGEAAILAAVRDAIADAKVLADLYAGLGTIGLRLAAEGRQVHAAEGDEAMVAALRRAAGLHGLRLTAECRDLARQPLSGPELERFDTVLFDPPRAGAASQAAALAASPVQRIVAISCNPATLARDLRILVDGGYHLDWVRPIDQFPWAAHLEAVACLHRPG